MYSKRNILYVLIICIVAISLYGRILTNDYVGLDDTTLVVDNYPFLKNSSNIVQVFRQGVFQTPLHKDTLTSFYRPMVTLSLMADAHFTTVVNRYINPKPFFISNMLFHLIALVLLFFLLCKLSSHISAFLLTLIFAVHPLINQAIAWIPGRNDSLLTIFILASMLFLIQYSMESKTKQLLFHIIFFALALFTKENTLMFIPLVLYYLYFISPGKLTSGNFFKILLLYVIVTIPWFYLREKALETNMSNTLHDFSQNLIFNLPYLFQYFGKTFIPLGLSVMSTPSDTNYLIVIIAITVISLLLYKGNIKQKNIVLFGFLWFILFLIPSLFSQFSGLEHRAYLPLVGLLIAVSQIDSIKNLKFSFSPVSLRPYPLSLILILIIFYSVSSARLHIFKNRFNFNESAIQTSPHAITPCLLMAKDFEDEGFYTKAIEYYRKALQRDSTLMLIHSNIAGDYIRLNQWHEAQNELQWELLGHPDNYYAVFNLGLVLYQGFGKDSDAVSCWEKSIHMDSGFLRPYTVLSGYYVSKGDSAKAERYRILLNEKTHL